MIDWAADSCMQMITDVSGICQRLRNAFTTATWAVPAYLSRDFMSIKIEVEGKYIPDPALYLSTLKSRLDDQVLIDSEKGIS